MRKRIGNSEWWKNPDNKEKWKESHRLARERIAKVFDSEYDALEAIILEMKDTAHYPMKFRFKVLNEKRKASLNGRTSSGKYFTKYCAEVSHCGKYFLISPESSDHAKIVMPMGELKRLEVVKRVVVFIKNTYRKYVKKEDEE